MFLKRIIAPSLLLACFFTAAHTQEQLGLRLSNYGGINSALLNPAYHSSSPFSWDVNLLEGAFHLHNDYAYFENTRLGTFLKDPEMLELELAQNLPGDVPRKEGLIAVDFFRNRGRRQTYNLVSALGPSFFVQIGGQHRLGLLTRSRAMLTARAVDESLSYYNYLPQPFYEDFPVGPLRAAAAGWSEVGLNYTFQAEASGGGLAFGITLKGMRAYEGLYARNDAVFQLAKATVDSLRGTPVDFKFGFTSPSSLIDEGFEARNNGGGLALDLGVVFTTDGRRDAPYDWKAGISILDLGKLNFRNNASDYQVQTDEIRTIRTQAYRSFRGPGDLEEYARFFSSQVLGDSSAALSGNSFAVWLPTALSLQLDKAFGNGLFLGAALVQGVPLGDGALQRGSLLAAVPRFESRWIDISLPLSVYEWEEFRLGLAARLAFLTIGTDDLGSIFRRSDFNGTDLYLALKFNPFKIFGGNKRRPRRMGGRNKGGVRCYEF